MSKNPQIQTLTVATREQSYILAELHMSHGKLARLLEKIRKYAGDSLTYSNLDTLFLSGATRDLPDFASEYETLRHAAKLIGCTPDQISAVCVTGHVLVEATE